MANLKKVFQKAADTAFKIFIESVKPAVWSYAMDNGFDDVTASTKNVNVILASFAQEDVSKLSFGDLIQPTDVKCLLRGSELDSVEMRANTTLTITATSRKFSVEAFDVDPYNILYTLLLRDTA